MPFTFTREELYILRAALYALDSNAHDDEPHYAHTNEFVSLLTKINQAIAA